MLYVDDLHEAIPSKEANWKCTHYCRLMADSLEELLAFCKKVYLSRRWIHENDGEPYHIFLTKIKRRVCLIKGAIELTEAEAIEKWGIGYQRMLKRGKPEWTFDKAYLEPWIRIRSSKKKSEPSNNDTNVLGG